MAIPSHKPGLTKDLQSHLELESILERFYTTKRSHHLHGFKEPGWLKT